MCLFSNQTGSQATPSSSSAAQPAALQVVRQHRMKLSFEKICVWTIEGPHDAVQQRSKWRKCCQPPPKRPPFNAEPPTTPMCVWGYWAQRCPHVTLAPYCTGSTRLSGSSILTGSLCSGACRQVPSASPGSCTSRSCHLPRPCCTRCTCNSNKQALCRWCAIECCCAGQATSLLFQASMRNTYTPETCNARQ